MIYVDVFVMQWSFGSSHYLLHIWRWK